MSTDFLPNKTGSLVTIHCFKLCKSVYDRRKRFNVLMFKIYLDAEVSIHPSFNMICVKNYQRWMKYYTTHLKTERNKQKQTFKHLPCTRVRVGVHIFLRRFCWMVPELVILVWTLSSLPNKDWSHFCCKSSSIHLPGRKCEKHINRIEEKNSHICAR